MCGDRSPRAVVVTSKFHGNRPCGLATSPAGAYPGDIACLTPPPRPVPEPPRQLSQHHREAEGKRVGDRPRQHGPGLPQGPGGWHGPRPRDPQQPVRRKQPGAEDHVLPGPVGTKRPERPRAGSETGWGGGGGTHGPGGDRRVLTLGGGDICPTATLLGILVPYAAPGQTRWHVKTREGGCRAPTLWKLPGTQPGGQAGTRPAGPRGQDRSLCPGTRAEARSEGRSLTHC